MKKQLLRFLIVGISTVLLDYLCYKALLSLGVPNAIAKTGSFLIGSVYAYFLNKYYTFEKGAQHKTDFLKFILLYLVGLSLNVSVNSLVLWVLGDVSWQINALHVTSLNLAFLFATGTSTVTNFIGQKFWVFR